jgi:hypothetical protein
MHMDILPVPGQGLATTENPSATGCRTDHCPRSLCWSAFWDKEHGVWRVAEDDPSSDLYAESTDANAVIAYMKAHS